MIEYKEVKKRDGSVIVFCRFHELLTEFYGTEEYEGFVTHTGDHDEYIIHCPICKAGGHRKHKLYISGDLDGFSLSNYSSSELQSIYKKECNVSGEIEESEYAEWLDEVEGVVRDSGKLGKGYPFSKTRWTYDSSKTGQGLASGITLTLTLYDD